MTASHILLVDDDPPVRSAMYRILTKAGYKVTEAASGAEALRLAEALTPELVLLDVVLPDVNGIEVCRQLKSRASLVDCVVVLVSGLRITSDQQAVGLLAGADGYIVKPIGNQELLARLQSLLRLRETQRALRCEKAEMEARTAELHAANAALRQEMAQRQNLVSLISGVSAMRELLLAPEGLAHKLRCITGSVVDVFGADFARIWLLKPGDRCEDGCPHATAEDGPCVCRDHSHCLHLVSSSGRYTQTDGAIHSRVPLGASRVGRVAAGEEARFLANDIAHDPSIVDPAWAQALGLVAFAGYRLTASDGETIGVLGLFSRQAITAEEDALLAEVAATASHVVQSARADERLRASERLFSVFMAHLPADAFVKDAEGRILFVNEQMNRTFGARDWIGKTVPELFAPAVAERMVADDQVAIEDGLRITEEEVSTRDGTLRVFQTVRFRIDGDAAGPLVGGVAWDVTGRKQVEAALAAERALLEQHVAERTTDLSRANDELARAARLKDEFLASMSHELRTPLNAVLGLSEALQEEVYGPLTERQLSSLQRIGESGRHLLELINDILDLSKIEAGKMVLQQDTVSIATLCESCLRMIRQDAVMKRVLVSSSLDSRITTIVADARRLKQILINLLNNAVKFTPEGGEIGLEVIGDPDEAVIHFAVYDTGIGIAPEDLPHLFQPFVQLDAGLTRQYGGTGLGLSMVRRLTELHGGSVQVESSSGVGSRFTVSLPVRQPAVRPTEEACAPRGENPDTVAPPSDCNGTVLLVEDNEANVLMLSEYLEALAYQVTVARDGIEALQVLASTQPDIVLMDIQMPRMDGLATIRQIRAGAFDAASVSVDRAALSAVPIVALTALAMPGDQERCLAAGADVYLSKPVSLKQLRNVMAARTTLILSREPPGLAVASLP